MASEDRSTTKIVILGGGGVGKSCLTVRMVFGNFKDVYNPTVEDSYRKNNFQVDGEVCPIEIYDTAGQDEFKAMRDVYYKTGHGFILAFSITDSSSLDDVTDIYDSILTVRGCSPSELPPIMLVGTKCDLEHQRVVSQETGQKLARKLGENVEFIETSAKADINVLKVFEDIVRQVKTAKVNEQMSAAAKSNGRKKKKKCTIL